NLNNRQRDHGRPLKPQVLQPPLESAGYCSPGKYVYVHAVAMYILLSVDNVLIQMNWREMAICLIQLI
ncbi:hypothetical protein PMQ74_05765, partial [Bifidobacterium longum]|nr:hypothetical protein [Bifidobacterium longum]MDB6686234.1 hypothetical protein [Bifidobacterium longum]MDB6688160.1 hypothetical protein [Bifidobacterium longum]MDB6690143.1 hypothetical protein [Bifidobacterium longum]MDB6692097.1 hypothetical protein [Bifidobacterium longum]